MSALSLSDYCPVCWLNFSADHPALPGHFPGRPVIPGVMLLAEMQTMLHAHIESPFRLSKLPAVKFLRPVLPQEPLQLAIEFTHVDHEQARGRFICRSLSAPTQVLAQGTLQLHWLTDAS